MKAAWPLIILYLISYGGLGLGVKPRRPSCACRLFPSLVTGAGANTRAETSIADRKWDEGQEPRELYFSAFRAFASSTVALAIFFSSDLKSASRNLSHASRPSLESIDNVS